VADDLTSESLATLLETLSPDSREAVRAYSELRNALVRFFQLRGDSAPDEAADVALDRVAEKLAHDTKIDDLNKYCFTVAKYVFLERLRLVKKQKLAAEEFYFRNDGRRDRSDEDLAPFRECFAALSDEDRKILTMYFADLPADRLYEYRRQLAESHEGSINYLRIRIYRLRRRLEDCVRGRWEK
jgi:hypothetical protein